MACVTVEKVCWRVIVQSEVRQAPAPWSQFLFRVQPGRLLHQEGDVRTSAEGKLRVPVLPRGWIDRDSVELVVDSSTDQQQRNEVETFATTSAFSEEPKFTDQQQRNEVEMFATTRMFSGDPMLEGESTREMRSTDKQTRSEAEILATTSLLSGKTIPEGEFTPDKRSTDKQIHDEAEMFATPSRACGEPMLEGESTRERRSSHACVFPAFADMASPMPAAAGKEFVLRERRASFPVAGQVAPANASAWEYPLTRTEKLSRVMELYESEMEHSNTELDELRFENEIVNSELDELRAENEALRECLRQVQVPSSRAPSNCVTPERTKTGRRGGA